MMLRGQPLAHSLALSSYLPMVVQVSSQNLFTLEDFLEPMGCLSLNAARTEENLDSISW